VARQAEDGCELAPALVSQVKFGCTDSAAHQHYTDPVGGGIRKLQPEG
jgi:hypothetical protein